MDSYLCYSKRKIVFCFSEKREKRRKEKRNKSRVSLFFSSFFGKFSSSFFASSFPFFFHLFPLLFISLSLFQNMFKKSEKREKFLSILKKENFRKTVYKEISHLKILFSYDLNLQIQFIQKYYLINNTKHKK